MSDILFRIATIHRERLDKANKKRLEIKKQRAQQVAYFQDTGIMAMWEDVKDIKIPNCVPTVLEGLTITLNDLLAPNNDANISGTGLVLCDKDDTETSWRVEVSGNALEYVHWRRGSHAYSRQVNVGGDNTEAKNDLIDNFVKWLSRLITPTILAEMDSDLIAPSLVKRSRKILQLAEG